MIKQKEKSRLSVIESINKLRNKDSESYLPLTLPFESKSSDSLANLLVPEEGSKTVLIQFPRVIPFNLENQNEFLKEEKEQEAAYLDEDELKDQLKSKKDFPNMFRGLKKSCQIGSLQVMKSGEVRMKIGDIYFNVDKGANADFYQEVKAIYKAKEMYDLGLLEATKMVVTPKLE